MVGNILYSLSSYFLMRNETGQNLKYLIQQLTLYKDNLIILSTGIQNTTTKALHPFDETIYWLNPVSNFFSKPAFITGVIFGPLKLLLGIIVFFTVPSFFKDPLGLHKIDPIRNEKDAKMGYLLLMEYLSKKQPVLGRGILPGTENIFDEYHSYEEE